MGNKAKASCFFCKERFKQSPRKGMEAHVFVPFRNLTTNEKFYHRRAFHFRHVPDDYKKPIALGPDFNDSPPIVVQKPKVEAWYRRLWAWIKR